MPSFTLTATPAHDAVGATVPTTLVITGADVVTLTVHHRAGNPAAGEAPFTYPVVAGSGWSGGFRTIVVELRNPNRAAQEQALREASQPAEVEPPPKPDCHVPNLVGLSRKEAAGKLRGAHCT